MKNKTDLFFGLAILVFSAVMGSQIALIPENVSDALFNPYSFPRAINYALAVLASALVIKSLFDKKSQATWPEKPIMIRIVLIVLLVVLYILGFIYIGEYAYNAYFPMGSAFSLTTFLFLCAAQYLCGRTKPAHFLGVALIYTVAAYFIFGKFFNVPLP